MRRGPLILAHDMLVGTVELDGTLTMRVVKRTSESIQYAQALALIAERTSDDSFDIDDAISRVRQVADPHWREAELVRQYVELLAGYDRELATLLPILRDAVDLDSVPEHASRGIGLVMDLRNIEKTAREREMPTVAGLAKERADALKEALLGEPINDSQEHTA